MHTSTPEQIAAEWEATAGLPPDQRQYARDILAVRHGAVVLTLLRDLAISAAPNVIRLADARAKLPRGEG